jgi:hypothetical protein
VKLDAGSFNAFLATIGHMFSWRRAYACPCINPHSNAAKPGCPLCAGKGRQWVAAVDGLAGIAGQKIQLAWAQFGNAELGDVVLTIPSDSPLYDIGAFDRVVMKNSSTPFSLVFTRGSNDVLRYPLAVVDRVFWLNDAGTVVIEGGIPTVSSAGALTWATGEPPTGRQYTITGRFHPEYFVFSDYPQDRAHHQGEPLPRRVVLRKFDLLGK